MFKVLEKVYNRNAEWVEYELNEISASHEQEIANQRKSEGNHSLYKINDDKKKNQ
jgi:hypothetical protein